MRGRAAIALGSNLGSRFGDREANLREAVRRVGALGEMRAVSSFYDTEPVGYVAQPRFLNAALLLDTELGPEALMQELLGVERAMGRERVGSVAKGPRVIDLDLLGYDVAAGRDGNDRNRRGVVMATEGLTLPHGEMAARRFVLQPLAEIAPEWFHPVLRKTARELLAELDSRDASGGVAPD
jgi:2-amino-4-hydroxy-6-hydroxymethyldihydropteridine diphosphokinase